MGFMGAITYFSFYCKSMRIKHSRKQIISFHKPIHWTMDWPTRNYSKFKVARGKSVHKY